MKQNETNLSPKIPNIFGCTLCDYNTSNKKDYNKHLLTQKHKNKEFETTIIKKSPKCETINQCSCGMGFNSRTTLWRHKKKCSKLTNLKNDLVNEETQQQLADYLLKENSEFKHMMLEQNKQIIELAKNSAGHHNNTTNNNNNFN